MGISVNVALSRELKKWVDEQVRAGGYDTPGEFMRDIICQAREREARRDIDSMLIDAVQHGTPTPVDTAEWEAIRKSARATARNK